MLKCHLLKVLGKYNHVNTKLGQSLNFPLYFFHTYKKCHFLSLEFCVSLCTDSCLLLPLKYLEERSAPPHSVCSFIFCCVLVLDEYWPKGKCSFCFHLLNDWRLWVIFEQSWASYLPDPPSHCCFNRFYLSWCLTCWSPFGLPLMVKPKLREPRNSSTFF